MIKSFKRLTTHNSCVSNYTKHISIFMIKITCNSHPYTTWYSCWRMSSFPNIMNTFLSFLKTTQPFKLSKRCKIFSPSCQYLMHIRLMSYVINHFILWRIKNIMKCYCQFNNTKIARKMTTSLWNALYNKLSDITCKIFQLLNI